MHQISLKNTRFSTWRPWPLTYDLDLYTRPRYGLGWSPYQIWRTYSTRFWRYEFFSSDFFSSNCESHVFQHSDLDLWPMTLSFTDDLDMVHVHHHTKFGDHKSNGSWDMIFFLVTFFLVFVTDGQKATYKSPPWQAQVGSKTWQKTLYKTFSKIFSWHFHSIYRISYWHFFVDWVDVVVSPPAFVWDTYLTLTNVTFDPDPCDLWPWYLWALISK